MCEELLEAKQEVIASFVSFEQMKKIIEKEKQNATKLQSLEKMQAENMAFAKGQLHSLERA